jgi:hypothetical protein
MLLETSDTAELFGIEARATNKHAIDLWAA